MTRGIDVTVAAIIERDGKFLMVEERAGDRLVLNQPAGHLEQGEPLIAAAARETLEETGHRFEPEHVVGFYLWRSPDVDTTYLRIAFCGSVAPSADVAAASLDDGIVAVHWLSRIQLLRRSDQLRSPMVLRCLDDYSMGQRYPLDCLTYLEHCAADLDSDATDVRLRAFT